MSWKDWQMNRWTNGWIGKTDRRMDGLMDWRIGGVCWRTERKADLNLEIDGCLDGWMNVWTDTFPCKPAVDGKAMERQNTRQQNLTMEGWIGKGKHGGGKWFVSGRFQRKAPGVGHLSMELIAIKPPRKQNDELRPKEMRPSCGLFQLLIWFAEILLVVVVLVVVVLVVLSLLLLSS